MLWRKPNLRHVVWKKQKGEVVFAVWILPLLEDRGCCCSEKKISRGINHSIKKIHHDFKIRWSKNGAAYSLMQLAKTSQNTAC
jgi:hypothetical protein